MAADSFPSTPWEKALDKLVAVHRDWCNYCQGDAVACSTAPVGGCSLRDYLIALDEVPSETVPTSHGSAAVTPDPLRTVILNEERGQDMQAFREAGQGQRMTSSLAENESASAGYHAPHHLLNAAPQVAGSTPVSDDSEVTVRDAAHTTDMKMAAGTPAVAARDGQFDKRDLLADLKKIGEFLPHEPDDTETDEWHHWLALDEAYSRVAFALESLPSARGDIDECAYWYCQVSATSNQKLDRDHLLSVIAKRLQELDPGNPLLDGCPYVGEKK